MTGHLFLASPEHVTKFLACQEICRTPLLGIAGPNLAGNTPYRVVVYFLVLTRKLKEATQRHQDPAYSIGRSTLGEEAEGQLTDLFCLDVT